MKQLYIFILSLLLFSCGDRQSSKPLPNAKVEVNLDENSTSLVVLGTIQDAGSPHIACQRECCKALFLDTSIDRRVVSLGLVDNHYNKKYLFEATPNITRQLKALVQPSIKNRNEIVDGIFLTHAHIGHYIGLMYLGKEATNAKNVPVFAMPRMRDFLSANGPWSQLVSNNNIQLQPIENERAVVLTPNVTVTPFLVPHRDEYSETVGYKIQGPSKSALFIPDIDKWGRWDTSIVAAIKTMDYAFLDATFYSGEELNTRDISQIPHPFVIESLELFKSLEPHDRAKIVFIHFNHTNPVINPHSKEAKYVLDLGFNIARINAVYEL